MSAQKAAKLITLDLQIEIDYSQQMYCKNPKWLSLQTHHEKR
ncbi:hypothetical protein [Halocola ammonii]